MVSVGEEFELDEVPDEVLDEHAATPAARTATALTATSFLGPSNLLLISFSCRRDGGQPPMCAEVN
jgi:hypothetical protein